MTEELREFALACPHCGEENPPEFPVCWSCHGALPISSRARAPDIAPEPEASAPDLVPRAARRRRIAIETAVALGIVWVPWFAHGILSAFDPPPPASWGVLLVWSLQGAAVLALVWFLAWMEGDWRRFLGLRRPRFADVLWAAGTFVLILVACDVAWRLALLFRLESSAPPRPPVFAQDVAWIAPVHYLLFALVEETFYRAYLWRRLRELSGRPVLAIVAVAALFSVAHGYPLADTLSIFVGGLVWGAAFAARRSLWPAVLSHWAFNTFVAG
jgi:membrane protease YdiL (CAAX protease family)